MEHTSGIEEVSIPRDIARLSELGILGMLLKDYSTGGNIIWGTSAYEMLGTGYCATDEMTVESITGEHIELIRRRARKDKDERSNATRTHAEVFTPTWICKMMIDHANEAWLKDHDGNITWKDVVKSPRLEITCGEAPYLFGRYDAADGTPVPFEKRIGILDRKLQLILENTSRRQDFMSWALEALRSVYGYEFQGDNLLIARINAFTTIEDALKDADYMPLNDSEAKEATDIIGWNLWQMDGLTKCVPFGSHKEENPQMDLFGGLFDAPPSEQEALFPDRGLAKIRSWSTNETVEFNRISREGKTMKFDYIIGNPPYQEEQEGDNETYAPSVYNKFMDSAYEVSDKVELIHPARFLFHAGNTPKDWNEKMLADPNFKILWYEQDSSRVFPNTSITAGLVISYHDRTQHFGPIGTFTPFSELNSILPKVLEHPEGFRSLTDEIFNQTKFDLNELYRTHPEFKQFIGSGGRDKRFRNNIFDKVPIFTEEPKNPSDAKILGVAGSKRIWRYLPVGVVDTTSDNLEGYKVIVSAANGASGTLGREAARLITVPFVGFPNEGYTQTFISIGNFKTEEEADACVKYIKSKFARGMLGILKVTQHNPPEKWKYVPSQDFSKDSDIDWSRSIHDIDLQLYKKYALNDEEINFLETHVKEMV